MYGFMPVLMFVGLWLVDIVLLGELGRWWVGGLYEGYFEVGGGWKVLSGEGVVELLGWKEEGRN